MTTTVLGKTRFNITGEYSSSTAYAVDDLVLYNNQWYRCKAVTTAGTLPTDDTKFDQFYQTFVWKGIHDNTSGTVYKEFDIVTFKFNIGSTITDDSGDAVYTNLQRNTTQTYICIADHTADGTNATLPHKTTLWKVISTPAQNKPDAVNESTAVATDKLGVYGGDWRKCLWFANEGIIYDQHPQYTKGYKVTADSYYNMYWIGGDGGVYTIGPSSSGSSGNSNHGAGPKPAPVNFHFHDWYRSTDNGGTGTLTTPDGLPPKCIQLDVGYDSCCALFNNGEVHSWGYNGNYEVGDRTTTARWQPARTGGTYGEVATGTTSNVLRDTKIVRISRSNGGGGTSSANHTLALDSTGAVWAWGYNNYAQCGNGTTTNVQVPTKIAQSYFNNERVEAIWAFGNEYGYNFAYTSTGKLFAWGSNNYGQLGLGDTTNRDRPTLVNIDFTDVAIGSLVKMTGAWGGSYNASGFLTSTGRVYMCGYNVNGILNTGGTSNLSTFNLVSSGPGSNGTCENFWLIGNAYYGQAFYKSSSDNKLYANGYNGQYNLADTTTTQRSTVVECLVRIRGSNVPLLNVIDIVGGGTSSEVSTIALTSDGRAYTCGYQQHGGGTGQSQSQTYAFISSGTAPGNTYEYIASNGTFYPIMVNSLFAGTDRNGDRMIQKFMATGQSSYVGYFVRNKHGRLMCFGNGSVSLKFGSSDHGWGTTGTYTRSVMGDIVFN